MDILSKKIIILSLISLSLFSCAKKEKQVDSDESEDALSEIESEKRHEIHTILQKMYLDDPDYEVASAYAMGQEELSIPVPYNLDYEQYSIYKGEKAFEIEVSEYQTFNKSWIFKTSDTNFDIYNLKIHTKYYYRVCEDNIYIETGTFETNDSLLRNIFVEGVTNFRDLGGYYTSYNKWIRQGILYRSARINDNYTQKANITSLGLEWVKRLGLTMEMDLRTVAESGINVSLLPGVRYISCDWGYSEPAGIFASSNYPIIRKAFVSLANKDNYPMFVHCNIGTDRTGTLSMFLLSILGVDYINIIRDYLFSNFASIGGVRGMSNLKPILDQINKEEGDTFNIRAENFLLNAVGVKQEEIDNIREIMLED